LVAVPVTGVEATSARVTFAVNPVEDTIIGITNNPFNCVTVVTLENIIGLPNAKLLFPTTVSNPDKMVTLVMADVCGVGDVVKAIS